MCPLPMVQAAFSGVFFFLFSGFPGSSHLGFLYYSCLRKGFFMSLEVLPMVQRRRKGLVPLLEGVEAWPGWSPCGVVRTVKDDFLIAPLKHLVCCVSVHSCLELHPQRPQISHSQNSPSAGRGRRTRPLLFHQRKT